MIDWVRVRDLQIGERLQTAEGAVSVEALEKVRGLYRVYNLEVEGDHEFLVGDAQIRAHNSEALSCAGSDFIPFGKVQDAARSRAGRSIAERSVTPLQTGGRTLSKRTLKALGLSKEQGKRAIEGLKRDLRLRNDAHGKILSDGSLEVEGEILGNTYDYVP